MQHHGEMCLCSLSLIETEAETLTESFGIHLSVVYPDSMKTKNLARLGSWSGDTPGRRQG